MIYKAKKKISENEWENMANELKTILDNGNDVIIDMKETEYISSHGIRILLMYLKEFRAKGYDFSIVNVENELLKNIFEQTGLDDVFLTNDNYFYDKKNGLK